jgi:hypothetical protein
MRGASFVQLPNHPNDSTMKMEKYHVICPGRGMVYAKDEMNYLMEESKCFSRGHLGSSPVSSSLRSSSVRRLIVSRQMSIICLSCVLTSLGMRTTDILHYDTGCDTAYAARHLAEAPPAIDHNLLLCRTKIDVNDIKVCFSIEPVYHGHGNNFTYVFVHQMFDDENFLSLPLLKHELAKNLTPRNFGFRDDDVPPITADMLEIRDVVLVNFPAIDSNEELYNAIAELLDQARNGKTPCLVVKL